ncbi:MAG: hypothetical protein JW953_01510 [Anaerolineae bacterium]|nr:hypothetical protein [Anaerolineae bacterium]
MKRKIFNVVGLIVLIMLLAAISLVAIQNPAAQAAPPAAPTPVSNILDTEEAKLFNFQTATAVAADTYTSWRDVSAFDSIDVQHVIDHGTVNTTTLTVQYSIDGTNAVNGLALVSNSAADGSDITRVPVFGKYMRIYQNLTSTDTITITLIAVGR